MYECVVRYIASYNVYSIPEIHMNVILSRKRRIQKFSPAEAMILRLSLRMTRDTALKLAELIAALPMRPRIVTDRGERGGFDEAWSR